MGTIRNLSDRFKALDFERIKQEALRETVTKVPELNREQLLKGQRSDGHAIEPQLANPTYAIDKQRTGGQAPFLTPDLYNTGSFQKQIQTIVTRTSLKTFSLDFKSPQLELKYTPLIFGLNAANLSKYALENVKPILLQKLKAATVGA